MKKKGIIRCVKEILLKHEGNTSEGAIYWDSEWVGGRQIPMGMGGWRQEGGKLVSADKAFYKEMADFISQELDKAREEGEIKGRLEALPITIEEIRNAKIKLLKRIMGKYKKMGSSAGDYAMVYIEEELSKLTTR